MKNSFKKVIAGLASSAIVLTQFVGMAVAYNDVEAGAWYAGPVQAFLDAGYLDANQTSLRPGDDANRAEFFTLVSRLLGGPITAAPTEATYADAPTDAYFFHDVESLTAEGIVKGDNNCAETGATPCNLGAARSITRAEAATVIVRAFNLAALNEGPGFPDVDGAAWYAAAMAAAQDHCIVQGQGDGMGDPAGNMNRAQMITMLYRVDLNMTYAGGCSEPMVTTIKNTVATSLSMVEVDFSMDVDATMGADAAMYVVSDGTNDIAVSSASVNGSTVTLTLASNLTAGKTYTVSVTDMKDSEGEMFSDSEAFTFQAVTQGDGDLEVTLSNPNQVGDTVPKGAVAVKMVSYDLTASCSDSVSVSRMIVVHEGAGDRSDIDNVYVSVNGTRVSSTKSIDSDEVASITISPALMVPACQTVQVDVAVDIDVNADSNGEHRFALYSADDVRSNAKSTTMNGPLRGDTFEIATVTAGVVDFTYKSISPNTVEIGDDGVTVSEFEVDASSQEDMTFVSITLEQTGTINSDDLENLYLYNGSTEIAGPATMMGDYVTFMVDEYIEDGKSEKYEVRADIIDGANDTIKFELEETSDLVAVGAKYGEGDNGQTYGSPVNVTNSVGSSNTVTVETGEFTIEIDGPASTTYAPETDAAPLAAVNFEIGGEAVLVNDLYFIMVGRHGSGSAMSAAEIDDRLSNVDLVSQTDGANITLDFETPNPAVAGLAFYHLENEEFRNTSEEFHLVADISNDALSGDEFQVHVCTTSKFETPAPADCGTISALGVTATISDDLFVDAEGIDSSEDLDEVKPGGLQTDNFMDVEESTLYVNVDTLETTDQAVKGADDISLMRFEVSASETQDVEITKLRFDVDTGVVGNDLDNAGSYVLYAEEDGVLVQVAGPETDDDDILFENFIYNLAKDETAVFEVHADVDNSVGAGDSLQLRFYNEATPSDFIEARDENGDDIDDAEITYVPGTLSTLWSFVDSGSLYITESSSLSPQQLVGGTADSVLNLEFEAEDEDVTIELLKLTTANTNASITTVDVEVTYPDNTTDVLEANVGRCAGESSPTAGSMFCVNTHFDVPANESVFVRVMPIIQAENAGGVSGEPVVFSLEGANASFEVIEARGVDSNQLLTHADADAIKEGEYYVNRDAPNNPGASTDIDGENNLVVFGRVTSVTNSGNDSSTIMPVGNKIISEMEIDTDPEGTSGVEIDGMIFEVIADGVTITSGSFQLFDTQTDTPAGNFTCTDAGTAPIIVTCSGMAAAAIDTDLEPGTSTEFALRATITGSTPGSSLQVSLNDYNDANAATFGGGDSSVSWVDTDGSATPVLWFDLPYSVVNFTSYNKPS